MSDSLHPSREHQLGQPYTAPGQPYTRSGQPYGQQPQQQQQQGQGWQPDQGVPPGQPYTQPGQPYGHPHPPGPLGQPYTPTGVPPRPGPPDVTPTPSSSGGATATRQGGLGRTAFVVAVISVAAGLLTRLINPFLFMSIGFGVSDSLSSLVTLLAAAGSAAGLILGLIALRRPAPRLLAAIAVGLAGCTVVGTVVSWMSSLLYTIGF